MAHTSSSGSATNWAWLRPQNSWRRLVLLWPLGAGVAATLMLPEYWLSILVGLCALALAAIGLALMLKMGGLLSLAQGTFVGVGMYALAKSPYPGWAGVAFALVAGIGVVAVVGLLVIRLRHFYFALGTLAIALVLEAIARGYPEQLGGPSGLPVTTTIPGLSTSTSYALTGVVLVQVALLLVVSLRGSRWGRAGAVVADDEVLADAVGVDSQRVRVAAYLAGSSFAVVGGVLFGSYLLFVAPNSLSFDYGFDVLVATLLGGMTPGGAILGAVVVSALPQLSSDQPAWTPLIMGVVVVVIVLTNPLHYFRDRLRRASTAGLDAQELDSDALGLVRRPSWELPERGSTVAATHNVHIAFGGVKAVGGLSVDVVAGRLTAIIGPNGAGKTTLFNLLAGALSPDQGEVLLRGRDVTRRSGKRRAQDGLARTFQLPRAAPEMTVLEAAQVGTHLSGRSGLVRGALRLDRQDRRESRRLALEALDSVGLGTLASRRVGTLSTGHRKLLEVARALAQQPVVILLDEPAGGLDPHESAALGRVIRELADAGLAVLFIEHSIDLVVSIADELAVMEAGQLLASGDPVAVRNDPEVLRAYTG